MAHAIEGYSRAQIGQTTQRKSQVKSTSTSKSQAVKTSSSNANAAVYTASRFDDVARNKSTYTAKATYTNPVLAKKQDTIARIAQSNKEAAKTTPNALSVAKNFFGGVVDAGVSTVVGLYNMGRHPVQTAKDIYNIAAHPSQTAEAIKGIAQELKAEFKEGNADVKSHMIGRAVGEIGLAIVGTKMVDKVAKGGKAVPAAKVTTEVTEAAEEAAKVAKAVGAVVKAEDEAATVGKAASKGLDLEVKNNDIKKLVKSPYSHLEDPQNVGPGKDFTPTQKNKIIEENRKMNDGVVRSDQSGVEVVKPSKSQKGVTPPENEWQIDHIHPKDKGGTNSYSNAQVLTRKENRDKWNK